MGTLKEEVEKVRKFLDELPSKLSNPAGRRDVFNKIVIDPAQKTVGKIGEACEKAVEKLEKVKYRKDK